MGKGNIVLTSNRAAAAQSLRSEDRSPLDPEAAAFLEFAAALGKPPSYALPYDEARSAVRAAGPQLCLPGPEMASIDDLSVPSPEGPIGMRLYTPLDCEDPSPLLIFFHGGGFVYCDLDTHDGLCRSLAAHGRCMVASVDYRLAPEYPFPAAPNDAVAATLWLQANAERLSVDPARIAVAGDSAGGNLAAGVCHVVPGLSGQLLLYPWLDFRMQHRSHFQNADGYMLTRAALLWFRSHYLTDAGQRRAPRASPLLSLSFVGLPPAFILTAGYDPLCCEGVDYAQRLEAAGVPVEHVDYAGQIHGFAMMTRIMSAADRAVRQAADWLTAIWSQPLERQAYELPTHATEAASRV